MIFLVTSRTASDGTEFWRVSPGYKGRSHTKPDESGFFPLGEMRAGCGYSHWQYFNAYGHVTLPDEREVFELKQAELPPEKAPLARPYDPWVPWDSYGTNTYWAV